MKPRNKFQQQVADFSKQLPKITDVQRSWAYKHCFEHIAHRNKKGVTTCLECGGEAWKIKESTTEQCVCPHCGATLKIHNSRQRIFKQIEYMCIVTKHKEHQVLRFFYLTSHTRKGEQAYYSCVEVVQRWIAPNGKYATMAMLRPMLCFGDYWQWSSTLEIRPEKELYDIMPTQVYPRMSVLPEIKRNGFTGNFCNLTPFEMLHTLLTNNKAETLLKTGQHALLKHFVHSSIRNINDYWNSINICTRNGYIVPDGSMWCDYINLLKYFGKDVSSAKYVCPTDLNAEHDRMVAKREVWREREKLEEQRQKMQEDEVRFKELKARYFGITFTNDTIEVRVLESVQEFYEEGKSLKHCLYSNEYHLKPDSLILSACIGNQRVETVEVSLKSMKVVQSRGVRNSNTEYHDSIVQLVNKNIRKYIRKAVAA